MIVRERRCFSLYHIDFEQFFFIIHTMQQSSPRPRAKLCLEDDSTFEGFIFGHPQSTSGEVVFTTGMVGYPESMTDPSYAGQILTFTYPLIGNYGVPDDQVIGGVTDNFESERIHPKAIVVSEYSNLYSHWDASRSLEDWMCEGKIPGIFGVDTRELTSVLRERGAMLGRITIEGEADAELFDPNAVPIVKEVSVHEPVIYARGPKKVIVIDCGVKQNIIRKLLDRNITVIRVPWDDDFQNREADGILISNGPGDPTQCSATIAHVRKALENNTPILGICLGSQILGLAAGAKTYKLKYGHRGHNQPCSEMGMRRCIITSQNHGFAIDAHTLPVDWREWFVNENDQTNEGIIHMSKPFFGVQFHPEASPGPHDAEYIFDLFVRSIR